MNEQNIPPQPKQIDETVVNLLGLVRKMWNGRKIIFISVFAGVILGIIAALQSPKEYTATSIIVPQLGNDSQSKLGGLGGLAALAGINLDINQGSDMSPTIYPQIISSATFQLELMNTPINFNDVPRPVSLFDYYTKYQKPSVFGLIKKYTIGLPGVLIKALKGEPSLSTISSDSTKYPLQLTNNQFAVKKALEGLLSLEVNAKGGYLTLSVRMKEALAAAQLAQKAQNLLQRYITEFKIDKVKANLNFIQERYNETKTEFEKAQVSLAVVNDRNKNFTSSLPQIEADRIQTRYTIAFNVFQELAKQLEQAKIQVKKDTPSFAIVQPVTVPSEKSNSNLPIFAFWLIFGGAIGIGIVFSKGYIETFKKQWNKG